MSKFKPLQYKGEEIVRYDFSRKVKSPRGFWRWLANLVARAGLAGHKFTVSGEEVKKWKPPYLVIGTHSSYLDLKTMVRALNPNKIVYVCSLDVLAVRPEGLLGKLGIIYKRKFVQDLYLLKNMKHAADNLKDCVIVMYPEAKFSLQGSTSYLPHSLGKLCKFLKIPVAVASMHGNYVSQPQWNRSGSAKEPKIKKGTPLSTELIPIADINEIVSLNADEIQSRIEAAMQYDDFEWQYKNGIKIRDKNRADGLHKLLYKCPHCGAEFNMESGGINIKCNSCGSVWELGELGELKGVNCETVYSHIPDWVKYEQEEIRKAVRSGEYRVEADVRLCTLPYKKHYDQGTAHFVQAVDGVTLTGTEYGQPLNRHWKANSLNGLHIEYNYMGVSDAFALSTLNESYWCFMPDTGIITKLSLANDEIYRFATENEQSSDIAPDKEDEAEKLRG